MKKLIKTLAIIGTLCNMSFAEAETPIDADQHPVRGSITLKTTGETYNTDYAEGDVMATPKVTTQVGDNEIKYTGTFRKATNTDGETTDLQTIAHNVTIDNGIWDWTFGRTSLREFGGTTATVGFDNYMAGKGMTRTFTGAFVGYQPLDVVFGIGSSDTTLSPSHWDMLMASWHHHFENGWGIQANIAATEDHVEKAGLAVEYKPTDDISLLADGVYGKTETSGMLLANLQLWDKAKLFAGGEVTAPDEGKTTGKLICGVETQFGHGLIGTAAVQHDFADNDKTKVVLGVKLKGVKDLF